MRRHRGGAAQVAQRTLMLIDDYDWGLDRGQAWMTDACRRLVCTDPSFGA